MITNVYIDGFNLFYRALKGTLYKWLDIGALCQRLLPQHEIYRIRYFTARVAARPDDPRRPERQQTYLRALQTIPNLTIHEGEFYISYPRMMVHDPDASTDARRTFVQVVRPRRRARTST